MKTCCCIACRIMLKFFLRRRKLCGTIKIVDCMDEICTGAAALFKKHTPKELKEHCEQLAYIRYQADAMGIIVEKLVAEGYLTVPEKRENSCVYGVKLAKNK